MVENVGNETKIPRFAFRCDIFKNWRETAVIQKWNRYRRKSPIDFDLRSFWSPDRTRIIQNENKDCYHIFV